MDTVLDRGPDVESPAVDLVPMFTGLFNYAVKGAERIVQLNEDEVDWSRVSSRHSPYKVQQAPGVKNALGQVKFLFPNQHSIFLHDTPGRSLFNERVRTFSSGCIRVEHPMELARALLGSNGKQSDIDLDAILDTGVTRRLRLPDSVPVHLVYLTAWVDENDELQFRHDVYNRDADQQLAVNKPAHRQLDKTAKLVGTPRIVHDHS